MNLEKIKFKFNEEKATQAAARLIKLAGGRIRYLSLMKLMYLADRESLREFDRPITGDSYVSMKYGPVLSHVYDLMIVERQEPGYWQKYISPPNDYSLNLQDEPPSDELCEAEEELLDKIFAQYGHIPPFKLAELTHEFCPEWEDPEGSSKPIQFEKIFRELGRTAEDIKAIRHELEEEHVLSVLLAD